MQNEDIIISAINIWRKYGGTLNDGSGNYLNWYTFLDFLKTIHLKFPKCYPFKDKSSPPPLQISEDEGLHRKEQGYSYPRVSSNNVPRVYDTRRGMEYSQTGSTCFEALLTL
ncbi:hypothetical protein BH23THE1_BH23THE1_33690 [soil metagenome]